MDKKKVQTLYAELRKRKGSMNKVAQRVGYRRQFVRQVLMGSYDSPEVIEAGLYVLDALIKKEQDRNSRIEELCNRLLTPATE